MPTATKVIAEKKVWTDQEFITLPQDSSTAFTMKSGNKRSPDLWDGEKVIPGFSLPVADLFQTLFF
ncbi:MAG: hypothetical protein EBV05_06575 [Cyanobacteria bacterium WB6_1B_304]|jgi:hypothetical protein|nr:hypothetical protein [Cyanobacteria bacterium WB6_1B_304]